MQYRNRQKRKIYLILAGIMLLTCYFLFQSLSGKRGIAILFEMQDDLARSQKILDEKRSKRLEIEHKVNLLRDESLDLDLLEEQARKDLGMSKKNEKIYDMSRSKKESH